MWNEQSSPSERWFGILFLICRNNNDLKCLLSAGAFHAALSSREADRFKSITQTAKMLLEYYPWSALRGNCLSSSISGVLTRETKRGDGGPMCEPAGTMRIFRDEAEMKQREASKANKQTLSTLFCQDPRHVECLWSK